MNDIIRDQQIFFTIDKLIFIPFSHAPYITKFLIVNDNYRREHGMLNVECDHGEE